MNKRDGTHNVQFDKSIPSHKCDAQILLLYGKTMKTAVLYGAGQKSQKAEYILRHLEPSIFVSAVVENKIFAKLGSMLPCLESDRTIPIISVPRVKELYLTGGCNAVIIPDAYHLFDTREILSTLYSAGIPSHNVYIVPYNRMQAPLDAKGWGLENVLPLDDSLSIQALDVHVVDNCNMGCTCCNHFSSLAPQYVVHDVETVRTSLTYLRQLIPNVKTLYISGGEPLLHPHLEQIVSVCRQAFPWANLVLITNGILLQYASQMLLDTLKTTQTEIALSLYPPMHDNVDSLTALLSAWGGAWTMRRIERFERRLAPRALFDPERQFAKCGHNMALRGSRIGYCVIALFADYYNTYFAGSDAPRLPEDPGVDIFAHTTGASLLNALQRPLELCAQCVSRDTGQMFFEKWEKGGENLKPDDWFIKFPFAGNVALPLTHESGNE